jgi:hypothetical protein
MPPQIYTCAEWGAKAPAHPFEQTNPTAIVIHHMDTPNRALESDPDQAIHRAFTLARACQQDHMQVNGWADTGQSYTISRDGVICEGRHGTLAATLKGHSVHAAHAADGNIDFNFDFGIENEGTYDFLSMPGKQWRSLVQLTGWLAWICQIDTAKIIGHRDTGISTDCPGKWLESRLPALRQQARQYKLSLKGTPPP